MIPKHESGPHAAGLACRSAAVSHRAFTVFELVIVLSLAAVLAAVALPRFAAATARYRADLAAQRMAMDIERVRVASRISSRDITISFLSGGRGYTVSGEASLDKPGQGYEIVLTGEPYHASIQSVDFGGSNVILFNYMGVAKSSGEVIVAAGGERRRVLFDSTTGTTSIVGAGTLRHTSAGSGVTELRP
ncbi:MAG: prepilin-type N-terminal cleavage/methylation domain-containing protein [Phycisphaeraceae bacterium]|nr:prepilin-type N-terminal cleavage/methylation domain-containing protein [Phycisphaeraceae bacterium]